MSLWKNYDGTCGKLSTMVQTYFKGIYIDTYPPKNYFQKYAHELQFMNLFQKNIYKLKTASDDGASQAPKRVRQANAINLLLH